jgi:hypothetical protein
MITRYYTLLLFSVLIACKGNTDTNSPNDTTALADFIEPRIEIINEDRPSPIKLVTGVINGNQIAIRYGSPAVKDREIWGSLVPFGEVWRCGANEATTMEFSRNATIGSQSLPAGKYSFYAIPNPDSWTLIWNKQWDTWGAYDYDESQDVLRVNFSPTPSESLSERLDFILTREGITLQWEYLKVEVPIR